MPKWNFAKLCPFSLLSKWHGIPVTVNRSQNFDSEGERKSHKRNKLTRPCRKSLMQLGNGYDVKELLVCYPQICHFGASRHHSHWGQSKVVHHSYPAPTPSAAVTLNAHSAMSTHTVCPITWLFRYRLSRTIFCLAGRLPGYLASWMPSYLPATQTNRSAKCLTDWL